MIRYSTIALACIALASCQTTPAETPVNDVPTSYLALGTEPFWSLKVTAGSMVFDNNGGEMTATADSYVTRRTKNGWQYKANNLVAEIRFTECSDGMSEFTYKDSVIVIVDDKKFEGCGGGILASDTLEGTRWRFTSINGAALVSDRDTAGLAFDKGRMSGGVGCNQLGADYSFKNKQLSVGSVMSTRMGCPDAIGTQEQSFVKLLGAIASTEFPGDGSMVLTSTDGSEIILQQLM
jgi:heat shock protein HslJ